MSSARPSGSGRPRSALTSANESRNGRGSSERPGRRELTLHPRPGRPRPGDGGRDVPIPEPPRRW
jgi:hypothetical protein